MQASNIAYIYDGTLEGLFTAVFMTYSRKEVPYIIAEEANLQVMFGQQVFHVKTDEALAKRVENGINKKMGSNAYINIWTAFLSCDIDKATKIYKYICVGMKIGRSVYTHLSHEDVMAVDKMCLYIGNESHLLKGFVRFSKMENGVYYAKITPNNSVLPVIMPHFSDRYSDQPFIIHDAVHKLAGVYDLREWYLVETDEINLPENAEDEADWKGLWRSFYNSIAIPERMNKKLRMGLMPKRYWQNMVEVMV